METEKLQRLHDTLAKLAPRGKVGGLGLSSLSGRVKQHDPSLPQNALYANFVRSGAYHKRNFNIEEENDAGSNDVEGKEHKKSKKKSRKVSQSIIVCILGVCLHSI